MIKKAILFILFTLLWGCKSEVKEEKSTSPGIAYSWAGIALEATANDTERFNPRPTVTSRYLGLLFAGMFDAWSRFDDKAVPVFLDQVERFPESDRTLKNKETAISYAAYRILSEFYFTDTAMFRNKMKELGFDPDNESLNPHTPEGIGNLAAKMLIEKRRQDGSNHYGERSNGIRYANYTGYQPVNSPDELIETSRWQPKYFDDGKGGRFAPDCLTPYWYLVEPIGLDSASQFRPGPPPQLGSPELIEQIKEVVELQANLTPEQKALVEFMRDGPKSVQQAGHWLIFSRHVSEMRQNSLDDDVKMYFYVMSVAMDAFIACWDSKIYYDFARPNVLVHDYYGKNKIKGWGGEGKGFIELAGEEWTPYSPSTFVCPPFPSYVSGHSTISGGCAEALRLWTGSDEFNYSAKHRSGSMTEPQFMGDTVVLHFPTFTQTAEMAGISRVLGGYHIQADNVEGLKMGRRIAHYLWDDFYQYHVNGE